MTSSPERPSASPSPAGLSYVDLRRAILLAALLFAAYRLAEPLSALLLFFLLVFILAAVLNPVVSWLERRRIPRAVSAVALAVGIMLALGLLAWLAVPVLLDELSRLFGNLEGGQNRLAAYLQSLSHRYPELAGQVPPASDLLAHVARNLGPLVGTLGKYLLNGVATLLGILVLLMMVVFSVANPAPLLAGLLSAVPAGHRDRAEAALARILLELRHWAFGSLGLGLIVGLMCGVGLWLLKVPYPLLFGVVAGVGEVIPTIGPILSAIPPVLVALTVNPLQALWVLLLYAGVQQLENNLIVPLVMGQSLRLHPVSIVVAVLVMAALFGLMGAVLAVPVCAIVRVCWEEFYLEPSGTDPQTLLGRAEALVRGSTPAAEPDKQDSLSPAAPSRTPPGPPG